MHKMFLAEDFFAALDAQRASQRLTWKKVAAEAGVSASTLTRIAQGRRPDVDTLGALCRWARVSPNRFFADEDPKEVVAEPLADIVMNLRADKNLTKEGQRAIETMVRAAYEQFRKG